jgi:hypothetical protein
MGLHTLYMVQSSGMWPLKDMAGTLVHLCLLEKTEEKIFSNNYTIYKKGILKFS